MRLLGLSDPGTTSGYIDRGPGDQAAQAVTDTIAAAWTGTPADRRDTASPHGPHRDTPLDPS